MQLYTHKFLSVYSIPVYVDVYAYMYMYTSIYISISLSLSVLYILKLRP